jgi:uncharacterized Zn finger protein
VDPLLFDAETVRQHTTEKVYARACGIVEAEQIVRLVRRGDVLEGVVWGSDVAPYHVRVRVAEDRAVREVSCTCPYSFEGWCKHAAAVVLSAVEMPRSIDVRPPLADVLAACEAPALRAALLALAEAHPHLADEIEARAEGREPDPPAWADPDEWGDGW